MGRMGFGLLGVGIFLGSFAGPTAYGENVLSSAFSVLLMGATHTENSRDYAKLIGVDPNVTVRLASEMGHCTATFINPIRVVTAAHCINPKLASGGVNIDGIASVAAHAHPGFIYPKAPPGLLEQFFGAKAEEEKVELNAFDIAVVDFPEGTAEFLGIQKFPPIAKTGFDKGHAYLGGYGIDNFFSFLKDSQYTGAGLLGWGVVNITARKDGVLETDEEAIFLNRADQKRYDKDHVAFAHALPGDSGASLFNEQGEIVGIVSAMLDKKQEDVVGAFGPFIVVENQRYALSNYIIDITSESSREELDHKFDPMSAADDETKMTSVSLTSIPSSPFEKVLLRTGQYRSGRDLVAVVPRYKKGTMVSLVVYQKLGTADREALTFRCIRQKCFSDDKREMIEAKLAAFTRFALESPKQDEPITDHSPRIPKSVVSTQIGEYVLD